MSKIKKYYKISGKNLTKTSAVIEDSDSESELIDLPPLSLPSNKLDDFIFKLDNHIYFTTDVTMVNINKLAKLIHQVNREYEITKAAVKCGMLHPSPIYLHITSIGGDLFAGFRGMDLIENSSVPIYTVVEGYAQSAGSMLFLAGKKRFMTENSFMLIHQLSSYGENGTFEQLKDSFSNNQVLMDRIVNIYIKKSDGKLTKKKLQELLKHDLFWDFKICKSYNLADELFKVI